MVGCGTANVTFFFVLCMFWVRKKTFSDFIVRYG